MGKRASGLLETAGAAGMLPNQRHQRFHPLPHPKARNSALPVKRIVFFEHPLLLDKRTA